MQMVATDIGFSSISPPMALVGGRSRRSCLSMISTRFPSNRKINLVVVAQDQPRRNANFHPTVWDSEFIISFTSSAYKYDDEKHKGCIEQLKHDVKSILLEESSSSVKLNLIDDIQRLGLRHHLDKEIKDALTSVNYTFLPDLHITALQFRLLRQNGFPTTSGVFNKFLDKNGEFMDKLKEDVKGLLSLYEASFLNLEGENVLEKARNFSFFHLKKSLEMEKLESKLSQQIQQSLEIPLHQRLEWVEARFFIDNIYRCNKDDSSSSSVLLELAKLNYNMVQSLYLHELKEIARWWKGLNFKKIYPFCRDRLVECYFFSMAYAPRPELSDCRKITAKWATLATVLDDLYDVYGSLDELHKLTNAFNRKFEQEDHEEENEFDLTAAEDIPEYMRPCYLAHYENAMEMVQLVSNNLNGFDILPYFKKNWSIYVRGYMKEAEWLYSGYMPTFDEYLENGMWSIASPLAVTHAFLGSLEFDRDAGRIEELLQLIGRPDSEFLYLIGIIGRFHDDLQSSKAEMERGELVNSISCYMAKERVSDEEARNQLKHIISDAWRKINDVIATKSLPTILSDITLNGARCWPEIYNKGDWFAGEGLSEHKKSIMLSFFEPIV